jgi:hypothetical protein
MTTTRAASTLATARETMACASEDGTTLAKIQKVQQNTRELPATLEARAFVSRRMGDLQLGFLGEEISADERHLVQSLLQMTNADVQCRLLRARAAAQTF